MDNFTTPVGVALSFEDLRKEICLLTVSLKDHLEGKPTSVKGRENDLTQLFSHISTMLAIGTKDDLFSSRVNAVTGLIQNDRIVSAVFTQNTNSHDESKGNLVEVIIGENGEELISNWKIEDVSFDQHMRDIVSILRYLFTLKTIEFGDLWFNFYNFLLGRIYRKLASRFNNGTKAWSKHPLHLIQDWYSSSYSPSRHPLKAKVIKATKFIASIRTRLSSQNVEADEEGNLHLTSENAKS
ncbi:hypothetical protein QCA50_016646 [Cerrena zonata]|uniref:Uncharacterized protein n=1 Tax=Cerrena zonata TaxID=2478898 RepID=A0AAW0FII4_9APHY